jgi:hypothetical protein
MDTQKFYYLQSCLTGEAKHVIEALSISSDNYQVAWELLKERYENKRLIGQTHIQAIFNLPAITKASATSLRQFSDSIGVHLKALKALQPATDQWDDLLIYIITMCCISCCVVQKEKRRREGGCGWPGKVPRSPAAHKKEKRKKADRKVPDRPVR